MKMSNNHAKYEVLIKQYLRSDLGISEIFKRFYLTLDSIANRFAIETISDVDCFGLDTLSDLRTERSLDIRELLTKNVKRLSYWLTLFTFSLYISCF